MIACRLSTSNYTCRKRTAEQSFIMGQKVMKNKLLPSDIDDIKSRVSFSEREIQDWYEEFKKSARVEKGKEYLTEREFITVYNKVFPGDSSDYVRHIVRTFDTDGDGKISFREFLIGLNASGSDDFNKNLRWAFEVYDISQNGMISRSEMEEIVKSVYKMLDFSNILLPPEYATPLDVVNTMFKVMDKDGDDNITWEEFREGVMADSFLLNLVQCNPPHDPGDQHGDHHGDQAVFDE
ncbi:hippocalcin-like protein 1 [Haliotis asinina]|uniref:hippocalcin-like protein 1 n=1 Tax=Haliotis asinina TaxID=109174 RepID=UPI00353252C1